MEKVAGKSEMKEDIKSLSMSELQKRLQSSPEGLSQAEVQKRLSKTAQLVQEAHTVSHFQRAVLKIGNYLILLAVSLVVLIITVAIFRGDLIFTTLQFALVLTVGAIPVAMPTVLSVAMAVGARLLARKKAIVSRLAAIERVVSALGYLPVRKPWIIVIA